MFLLGNSLQEYDPPLYLSSEWLSKESKYWTTVYLKEILKELSSFNVARQWDMKGIHPMLPSKESNTELRFAPSKQQQETNLAWKYD